MNDYSQTIYHYQILYYFGLSKSIDVMMQHFDYFTVKWTSLDDELL